MPKSESSVLFLFQTTQTSHFRSVGGVTYKFWNRGALLFLPNDGLHEDTIRTKLFEDYIRDHVDTWFDWAQINKPSVERIENLILVTGCTMVTSWAAAVCVDNTLEAEITLGSRTLSDAGASFVWRDVRGHVEYHNSPVRTLDYILLGMR